MDRDDFIASLTGALHDLSRWLCEQRVPFTVIGGLASSVQGRARITRDIDVLADSRPESCSELIQSAQAYGFATRTEDALEFTQESRVLFLTHSASSTPVDIVYAGLPYELEVIRNSATLPVAGLEIPFARPEDLIIMKLVAQRPRDLADIEGIIAARAELDWRYIEKLAGEFAAALDASDISRLARRFRAQHETGAKPE